MDDGLGREGGAHRSLDFLTQFHLGLLPRILKGHGQTEVDAKF